MLVQNGNPVALKPRTLSKIESVSAQIEKESMLVLLALERVSENKD